MVVIITPLVMLVDLAVEVVLVARELKQLVVLHHILQYKVMLEDMHGLLQVLRLQLVDMPLVAVVVHQK